MISFCLSLNSVPCVSTSFPLCCNFVCCMVKFQAGLKCAAALFVGYVCCEGSLAFDFFLSGCTVEVFSAVVFKLTTNFKLELA